LLQKSEGPPKSTTTTTTSFPLFPFSQQPAAGVVCVVVVDEGSDAAAVNGTALTRRIVAATEIEGAEEFGPRCVHSLYVPDEETAPINSPPPFLINLS